MIDLDGLRQWLKSLDDFGPFDLINTVSRLIQGDSRDLDDKDEPAPMDTLGSLIDKLITVDMKMWHNQEQLYAIRKMTTDQFVDRYGMSMTELHDVVKRCCDLNVQRARLVDAIDAKLAAVVAGTDHVVTAESHKTY